MFENNWILCRLIFRRDRIRILLWFFGIFALVVGFAAAIPDMYGSEADRLIMAESLKNPAMIAMLGPVYDSDGYSLGAMYSLLMLVWSAAIVGTMNIFHVVRHTRQDEEHGRIEVVRSLPVGRLSNLSAVLTTSVIINAALGLLLGLGLGALGNDGMEFAGSILFGAVMGVAGLVFAAITAIFCQLCGNPRTAQGLSFTFLVGAFFVRAVGDMQESEVLACISPLGLLMRVKAYGENTWWPVFVALLIAITASIFAFWFCSRRDMGEGIIPARPGRRDAKPSLKSPLGLAWRLLKTPVIIWLIVVPMLGISYGSIMGDIEAFIASNEIFSAVSGGDPMGMVSFLMIIMSICATIPVLQFILKARSEEKRGYAENVLARSASHYSQLKGYFIIALISAVLMPFLNAFGFWAGSTPVMDEPFPFSRVLLVSMVYVPALLIILGVAMVLIAYLPRHASLVWAVLGYSFFIIYLGGMMQLPEFLSKITPFGHIPQLPNVEFSGSGSVVSYEVGGGSVVAMVVMSALSVGMYVLGFIGYRSRDMKFSQ